MTLTDDQLAVVLQTAAMPLRDRQLRVLHTTYPGWRIWYAPDEHAQTWWVAELVRVITPAMRAAGVVHRVRRLNPVDLAAALTMQASRVHSSRVGYPISRPPARRGGVEPRGELGSTQA